MNNPKDLIAEARELAERATSGLWEYDNYIALSAFIARSRTLVPELCDALERAQAEVERLKTACRSCPGLSLMAAHGYGEIKPLPEPPERKGD